MQILVDGLDVGEAKRKQTFSPDKYLQIFLFTYANYFKMSQYDTFSLPSNVILVTHVWCSLYTSLVINPNACHTVHTYNKSTLVLYMYEMHHTHTHTHTRLYPIVKRKDIVIAHGLIWCVYKHSAAKKSWRSLCTPSLYLTIRPFSLWLTISNSQLLHWK